MSTRAAGYTYKRRRDGTRYRVYRRKSRYNNRFSGIKPKRASMRRSTITGFGAYKKVSGGKAYGRPPQVVNHPDGRVIIRHAEYLEDIPSATTFILATYPLNPGMSQTFPWLSRIAQNFEEWLPRGIFFEFKTTSSDMIVTGATTPALGQISMATQYNSLDSDFTNNVQLLNYENASTCKPSQNLRHYVECKRSQTVMDEMYIRTGPPPTNGDLRLYDLGKTSVSASNMQTNGQMMGQLWISYEIELRKPKIPNEQVIGLSAHWSLSPGLPGINYTSPFGDNTQTGIFPLPGSSWPLSTLVGSLTRGYCQMNGVDPGQYLVVYSSSSDPNPQSVKSFYLTPDAECQILYIFQGGYNVGNQGPNSGTVGVLSTTRVCTFALLVTGSNPRFNITWEDGYLDTPTLAGDFFVIQLSTEL